MANNSVGVIVKENLKFSKVGRFRRMGSEKAFRLVQNLSQSLPLGDRGLFITRDLLKRGYYRADTYLNEALPELTIGYRFDEKECELLDSLKADQVVSLFVKFGQDVNRARSTWHAYFQYNAQKAVEILDLLADKNITLLRKALLGSRGLYPCDASLVLKIFKLCEGEATILPVQLVQVGLNEPGVTKAVKELYFDSLSRLFIEPFIDMGKFENEDQAAVKSVFNALGVEKVFNLYKYLIGNRVIEVSEKIDLSSAKIGDEQRRTLIEEIIGKIKEKIEENKDNDTMIF